MAVPAGGVGDSVTLLELDAQDNVLEDLVERMADVQVTVGVGRAIVQEEMLIDWPIGALPCVEVVGALLEIVVAPLRRWTCSSGRAR